MNSELGFRVMEVPLWRVRRSRWQPRQLPFDEERLLETATSIRDNGLVNEVLVFPVEDGDTMMYELVAGERRTLSRVAAVLAEMYRNRTFADWVGRMANVGLEGLGDGERRVLRESHATIRAKVFHDGDMLQLHILAVTENTDREQLSPVEEARAYQLLQEQEGLSQREIALAVNKSQGYVAQRLGLLKMDQATQDAVNTRVIGLAHARALQRVPEALQPAVTQYVIGAVQDEDSAATTRAVENLTRQVAGFVNLAHWEPRDDVVYTPHERNLMKLIQWALGQTDTRAKADSIMALKDHVPNLLARDPQRVAGSIAETQVVLEALLDDGHRNIHERWAAFAQASGRLCTSCQFNNYPNPQWGHNGHCKRWVQERVTCWGYIGREDPTVIPIRDLRLQRVLPELGYDLHDADYMTDVGEYVQALQDAVAQREAEREARKGAEMERHIEPIRAYWEWQNGLGIWLNDLQAHGCEQCTRYAPELLERGLPPCKLVESPIVEKWGGGQMRSRAPQFGLLISRQGQIAPRCEGFAYQKPPQLFVVNKDVKLPSGAWVARVMHALGWQNGRRSHHVIWGPLAWLDYRIEIGGEPDRNRLHRYMLDHWDELGGDAGIAKLIELATREAYLMYKWQEGPYPIKLSSTDWMPFSWPVEASTLRRTVTDRWPAEWAQPWKSKYALGLVTATALV